MMDIVALHREIVEYIERFYESRPITADLVREVVVILNEKRRLKVDDEEMIQALTDRIVGWGPISSYLRDPSVTEIMVNGLDSVFIERSGVLSQVPNNFQSEEDVMRVIQRIVGQVGRRVDVSSPLVDARLPDGSRVNAIIRPLSLIGPTITIRRFPAKPMTLDDMLDRNSASSEMIEFLKLAVRHKMNVVISGGTGSGKTTLLNAVASHISEGERVVTIEDAAELRIGLKHLVNLEARPANLEGEGEVTVRALLKNALRMRPDRIIVGEVRGGEALDMLQAMNTGHQGSLTTVHANAPLEALLRIETMCLMSDVEIPLSAVREQIRQAIQLIVQVERGNDGARRIVAVCSLDMAGDNKVEAAYNVLPLFTYDRNKKSFVGHSSALTRISETSFDLS